MKKVCLVLCATKNIEEARMISGGLLREGLIACASIIQPVESWFVWKGQIEEVQEVQLFLKTSVDKYDDVERYIAANHSYEVPEIMAFNTEKGFAPYLNWINQSVEST